jgi:hypothetical protein
LSSVESRWHNRRVRTSVAPPAVKGTTNRTRRVGHSAAWPGVAMAMAATIARTAERMLIFDPYPSRDFSWNRRADGVRAGAVHVGINARV